MKRPNLFTVLMTSLFLLISFAGFAQEDEKITGKADITVRAEDGENQSPKFLEYRDIPEGLAGQLELNYINKDKYFFEFKAKDIAEDDQNFTFKTGIYGKYKLELIYDKIPHRFAYDARTLYSGVGTGNLTIADAIQDNLQNSTSAADAATRLQGYMNDSFSTDLEFFRKTTKANIDLVAFNPFNFRFEFSREERDGTKPFGASFGFSNPIEVAEPVDYDTTQYKFIAEYSKKAVHLNATLYLSMFDNNIGTLTFDNPFRVADSTSASAYSANYAAGASTGLMDLTPDNKYSSFSLNGSFKLPRKSYLSMTASWGRMRQDDDLVAYTTNTSIFTGAVTGDPAVTAPFNAWDRANLPAAKADAKVNTTLYNVLFTSTPLDFMHIRAKYRYYRYNNHSEQIYFPGYVRFDAVWEPEAETPHETSYKKRAGNIDLAFDLPGRSSISVGYTFEDMNRSENREVADSDEDIYKLTFDTKPVEWFDLRASYETSDRSGHYDYSAPFEGAIVTAQLPWLRKFDEANRDRDRLQLLANFYPLEALTISLSAIVGKDDYDDSEFGLLDNKHHIYSVETDYSPSDKWDLFAYYTHENYKNSQRARQWNASTTAGTPDPYYGTTSYYSPSNWETDAQDKVRTYGLGFNVTFIPEKLKFKLCYAFSKSNGRVNLFSPVGTATDDLNPWIPVDFDNVDDTKFHTLDAKLKYIINKDLSIAFGYMWEKMDFGDFNKDGFQYVPTLINGNFNPLLPMNTLIKNYDVDIFYAKIAYRF